MSKHKRYHSMAGKGAERKAYAFFHSHHPYGSLRGKAQLTAIKSAIEDQKKTAQDAANIPDGEKQTPQDP